MTRSQPSGSRRPTTPTIGSQSAREAKRQAPWLSGKYANLRLNITFSVFKSAIGEELVDANPVASVRRPKVVRRRWRILEPAEVPVVYKAFSDDRARRVFLTLVLTGLRRFELVGLRWRHVNLVEGTLRVETSKSEEGERLIALPTTLVDALAEQFTSSPYRSDDDYVFCHPEKGTSLGRDWYASEFAEAPERAGIESKIRASHDMRHTALTTLAATGASEIAVMATAGHRSMQTTKMYLTWRASCSATTRQRSSGGCSGYKVTVQSRRNPQRQAVRARASA